MVKFMEEEHLPAFEQDTMQNPDVDTQQQQTEPEKKQPRLRGFAGMDKEKRREIASKGGKAAHAKGTAHEFTSEEARAAGRKGGKASASNR